MGRFVLRSTFTLLSFLLLNCIGKREFGNCNPFCEGDEWTVYEFLVDAYPHTVPAEENRLLSSLENEMYLWKCEGDTLTLKGKGDERVAFKYEGGTDTLTLLAESGERRKFVFKERCSDSLHLEMVEMYYVDIYLKRRIDFCFVGENRCLPY